MKFIYAYLTFNGNCREAMRYYQECFGGKLILQTINKSPLSARMPAKMKACILHAELRNKEMVLMGTDIVSESGLHKGNQVSLLLNCKDKGEFESRIDQLTAMDKRSYQNVRPGTRMTGITDKFGVNWVLYLEGK